ncbi:hypothetical protein IWX90DRAFT_411310 [Phyllosticta citrichinensis]|uniref:Uncharacterized protein n=1 Tax=Phyllosticta citrichinensis TaxID=1130410 RepID=A0ABR1Y926_9PEZI
MNTIIVDVAPQTARTTSFYLLGAAIRVTDMLAAIAGSALLERDIWLPYEIATPVLLLSLPICLAMPKTLIKTEGRTTTQAKTTDSTRKDSGAMVSSSSSSAAAASSAPQEPFSNRPNLRDRLKAIHPSLTFALASNTLFLQYASAALHWSIARAGYLLSIKGALSLAVLIGLPVLGRWLMGGAARRRTSGVERQEEALEGEDEEEKAAGTRMVDVWVARGSLGLLAVGCWCVAGAGAAGHRGPGVMIFAHVLGFPRHNTLPLSAPPHSSGTGNLYGTLVLFELAAILLGNAAFAALYGTGADMNGSGSAWLGLPFWVAGVIFFLAMLVATALPAKE